MRRQAFHFTRSTKEIFGNPFRPQGAPLASPLTRLAAGFCITAALALAYWLLFTPAFAIEKISVDGTFAPSRDTVAEIVREQVKARRWGIVSQQNIFAFNSGVFARRVLEEFAVESVKVKKARPHAIAVTIAERPREVIWSSRGKYYAVDAQGAVLAQIAPTFASPRPTVYDESNAVPAAKGHVLNLPAMGFISQLLDHETVKSLRPQFFIAEKPNAQDLALKVGEGWKIYFDTTASLADQLQHLDLTLRSTISPDKRAQLDYIDLRFGEKVYYKYR